MEKIIIKPKVKNKYNIKPNDITKAIILDYNRLKKKPFWRNKAIGAWCLSDSTAKNSADEAYCTYSDYWIGFYDKDAKAYAGKIRLECSSYGGMCHYIFDTFYNPKDIENEIDLEIQEKLLSQINWLIDEKIIALSGDEK